MWGQPPKPALSGVEGAVLRAQLESFRGEPLGELNRYSSSQTAPSAYNAPEFNFRPNEPSEERHHEYAAHEPPHLSRNRNHRHRRHAVNQPLGLGRRRSQN